MGLRGFHMGERLDPVREGESVRGLCVHGHRCALSGPSFAILS